MVELPKFVRGEEQLSEELERWIRLFRAKDEQKRRQLAKEDQMSARVIEVLDELFDDPQRNRSAKHVVSKKWRVDYHARHGDCKVDRDRRETQSGRCVKSSGGAFRAGVSWRDSGELMDDRKAAAASQKMATAAVKYFSDALPTFCSTSDEPPTASLSRISAS